MPKIIISKKSKEDPCVEDTRSTKSYPLWKIARGYEAACKVQWPAPPKEFRRKAVSNA